MTARMDFTSRDFFRDPPALAYAEDGTGSGGTLTLTDGRHAAAIALLGNYMVGSFVATANVHGGTLISSTPHVEQRPLTHPQV